MYDNLARRAIIAALSNDWPTALDANLTILSEEPDNTDALNRGAKAYLQLGNVSEAMAFSQKVLLLDPLNSIAEKFIDKCRVYEPDTRAPSKNMKMPEFFLEFPGRTKIVSLINLCNPSIIARLDAGDMVQMNPKTHKVAVVTTEAVYVGRLPDDLATRIIYFIKNGNQYESFIKSASTSEVKVFIKETKRAEALWQIPSFPVR
jgi:tetratricopeptide (TPR) repeat protein